MFKIDTGTSADREIGWIEAAALDACDPGADRATVLAKAADLILLKMDRLKSMEGKRRNFWMNADLIREMAEAAPDAHDSLIAHLFWAAQPEDAVAAYCDALDPMPALD